MSKEKKRGKRESGVPLTNLVTVGVTYLAEKKGDVGVVSDRHLKKSVRSERPHLKDR